VVQFLDRHARTLARHGVLASGDNFATRSPAKLKCGARTRRGTACLCKALENGRYRLHAGASTGPKTADGRARIAETQGLRSNQWRDQRAEYEWIDHLDKVCRHPNLPFRSLEPVVGQFRL
jgi:hypothetical protein